ncbi:hypothetical protein HDU78_005403 [Chytriomyces hyalinus]|nr:hypothetical protein HDU78_005403 [Chytriomyces hyalinus]
MSPNSYAPPAPKTTPGAGASTAAGTDAGNGAGTGPQSGASPPATATLTGWSLTPLDSLTGSVERTATQLDSAGGGSGLTNRASNSPATISPSSKSASSATLLPSASATTSKSVDSNMIATQNASSQLSSGAIAAIAIAAIAAAALLFVGAPLLMRRRRNEDSLPVHHSDGGPGPGPGPAEAAKGASNYVLNPPDQSPTPTYIHEKSDLPMAASPAAAFAAGGIGMAAIAAASRERRDSDKSSTGSITPTHNQQRRPSERSVTTPMSFSLPLSAAAVAGGAVAVAAVSANRERRPSEKSTSSGLLSSVDENGPCILHPFAAEPHLLKDCHRYKKFTSERRFIELEAMIRKESEIEATVLTSAQSRLSFPVNLSGPCVLHPAAMGLKAHVLGDCTTFRTLVKARRFTELDGAFKKAAEIVAAVEPFVETPGVFVAPYFLNESAACALHPTATGDKKHKLANCYTYRRLVAAERFDELERLLQEASKKVEAVKKVTFAASSVDHDETTVVASGPDVAGESSAELVNENLAEIKSISGVTTKSYASQKSSMLSGRGYDASMSGYSGSTSPRTRRASGLKLLKLNRAGNWWRDATSRGSRHEPPSVVARNKPVLAIISDSERSVSSKSSSTSRLDSDGFVTAQEELSAAESYRTAATTRTSGTRAQNETDDEYFTAQEN